MNKFAAFLRDESGASAAEYVLILTIIGTGLALAITALGNGMATSLNSAADKLKSYTYP